MDSFKSCVSISVSSSARGELMEHVFCRVPGTVEIRTPRKVNQLVFGSPCGSRAKPRVASV
jgi:hypothetical protein